MKLKTTFFVLFSLITFLTNGQPINNIVIGNNVFAFDLLKNVFDTQKNIFMSPYSISSALAITYAGARNETERQMRKTLYFNFKQLRTHQNFLKINDELNKSSTESSLKLCIANALWIKDNLEVKPEFIDLTKKFYNASIFTLQGAQPINDWASNQTNGKIKEIVTDEIISNSNLILTNAIYFKGDWASTFEEKDTKKDIFIGLDGSNNEVDMMYQLNSEGRYFKDEKIEILEMLYKGETISMYIILPNENSNIIELVKTINNDQLTDYKSKLRMGEVKTFLPKFKLTSEYHLEHILPTMGMPNAFNSNADFSGMANDINIGEVLHKAVITVNEKGSEAAAVTAISVEKSDKQIFTFKANRPFLFIICDKNTESILFLGTVLKPTNQNK